MRKPRDVRRNVALVFELRGWLLLGCSAFRCDLVWLRALMCTSMPTYLRIHRWNVSLLVVPERPKASPTSIASACTRLLVVGTSVMAVKTMDETCEKAVDAKPWLGAPRTCVSSSNSMHALRACLGDSMGRVEWSGKRECLPEVRVGPVTAAPVCQEHQCHYEACLAVSKAHTSGDKGTIGVRWTCVMRALYYSGAHVSRWHGRTWWICNHYYY